VRALVESVRTGGEERLLELCEGLDGVRPPALEVPASKRAELAASVAPELRAALEVAARNIRLVAEAQLVEAETVVEPGQGQRVSSREIPVHRAAIYVPGGRASYPSTVLMGAIPARVAGVSELVVASPPTERGTPSAAVLAACEIADVDTVYAMGGAQAIAALAHGTTTVAAVDLIAGPGGPWVQEAKLAVSDRVGIDGYAGPSELVVISDGTAEPSWLGLDLCAQGEHGDDGLLVAIAVGEGVLDSLLAAVAATAAPRGTVADAELAAIEAPSIDAATELAEAIAPEHLQLACAGAERLARKVRRAGCVFVGPEAATAFGDYAVGSNHVLPTGGAARYIGPLGPGTFRRRISTVRMTPEAAVELGPIVDEIARAEGFPLHGSSARVRAEASSRQRG
jgi:histidinol dehydrogenase